MTDQAPATDAADIARQALMELAQKVRPQDLEALVELTTVLRTRGRSATSAQYQALDVLHATALDKLHPELKARIEAWADSLTA